MPPDEILFDSVSVLYLYFFVLIVLAVPFVHTTQTSIPQAGFEPATLASYRPLTFALDRSATEMGRTRTSDRPANYLINIATKNSVTLNEGQRETEQWVVWHSSKVMSRPAILISPSDLFVTIISTGVRCVLCYVGLLVSRHRKYHTHPHPLL